MSPTPHPRRMGAALLTALAVMATAVAVRGAPSIVGVGAAGAGSGGGSGANWVASWAPSPVAGSEIPWMPDCPAGKGLTNQTVRNVAFLSAGGSAVRVRVTNTFGATALRGQPRPAASPLV